MTAAPVPAATAPKRKASPKSARSRAREFALQALYQHLVGRNEASAIDAFTRDLAGFHKADSVHYDALLHGCVREAAALLERYLTGNLSTEGLEFALGLRRATGGSGLALKAKVAERDALLVRLAQRAPWAGMGPWGAARAMRASFAAYERNRYPGHSSRGTRPAGDDETWWLILQLKLSGGSMPKERRIAELIAEER